MALDYDRLCRLMMMTTSENGPEAHLALKKANDMLKKENMTWVQVLTPRPSPSPFPRRSSHVSGERGPGTDEAFFDGDFTAQGMMRNILREFGRGFAERFAPPSPRKTKKRKKP